MRSLHPDARPVIIVDETVARVIPSPLPTAASFTFPAGEAHKSRATWATLTDALLHAHYDRHTVVVAVGGGVTTDLAGFVAATFLRGVPWIAVPTTTLAMLDAAIGGKTGVNTTAGKNLVGSFHPPSAVLIDPLVLGSLPDRSFREGLAEAVKHAAIRDAAYGDWMLANAGLILGRDTAALEHLIHRSAEIKAQIVSADEREAERRVMLNAGHTVGHALELVSEFEISHGEAVGMGLVIETRLAERMGVAQPGTMERIAHLLSALGLPVDPPTLDPEQVAAATRADKKNRGATVRAALIESFGRVSEGDGTSTDALDLSMLRAVLRLQS